MLSCHQKLFVKASTVNGCEIYYSYLFFQVRVLVAPRLEVWLQNPKLTRPAQELLMSLCVNCIGHTQRDVEVISALVKIRLKTKNLINNYLAGVRYVLYK